MRKQISEIQAINPVDNKKKIDAAKLKDIEHMLPYLEQEARSFYEDLLEQQRGIV